MLIQSTFTVALAIVNECVPQYGRRNLQVASPGRRPARKKISSGLTSPSNIEQDIVTIQYTVWKQTIVHSVKSSAVFQFSFAAALHAGTFNP